MKRHMQQQSAASRGRNVSSKSVAMPTAVGSRRRKDIVPKILEAPEAVSPEENFDLCPAPSGTDLAYAMTIKLSEKLQQLLLQAMADGVTPEMKFGTNSAGHVLRVGDEEFKFTSNPENDASLCDCYCVENSPSPSVQKGSCQDATKLRKLRHVGSVARKLSVQRALNQSEKAKWREATQLADKKQKDRKIQVVDVKKPPNATGKKGMVTTKFGHAKSGFNQQRSTPSSTASAVTVGGASRFPGSIEQISLMDTLPVPAHSAPLKSPSAAHGAEGSGPHATGGGSKRPGGLTGNKAGSASAGGSKPVPLAEVRPFLQKLLRENPRGLSKQGIEKATGRPWSQLDKPLKQIARLRPPGRYVLMELDQQHNQQQQPGMQQATSVPVTATGGGSRGQGEHHVGNGVESSRREPGTRRTPPAPIATPRPFPPSPSSEVARTTALNLNASPAQNPRFASIASSMHQVTGNQVSPAGIVSQGTSQESGGNLEATAREPGSSDAATAVPEAGREERVKQGIDGADASAHLPFDLNDEPDPARQGSDRGSGASASPSHRHTGEGQEHATTARQEHASKEGVEKEGESESESGSDSGSETGSESESESDEGGEGSSSEEEEEEEVEIDIDDEGEPQEQARAQGEEKGGLEMNAEPVEKGAKKGKDNVGAEERGADEQPEESVLKDTGLWEEEEEEAEVGAVVSGTDNGAGEGDKEQEQHELLEETTGAESEKGGGEQGEKEITGGTGAIPMDVEVGKGYRDTDKALGAPDENESREDATIEAEMKIGGVNEEEEEGEISSGDEEGGSGSGGLMPLPSSPVLNKEADGNEREAVADPTPTSAEKGQVALSLGERENGKEQCSGPPDPQHGNDKESRSSGGESPLLRNERDRSPLPVEDARTLPCGGRKRPSEAEANDGEETGDGMEGGDALAGEKAVTQGNQEHRITKRMKMNDKGPPSSARAAHERKGGEHNPLPDELVAHDAPPPPAAAAASGAPAPEVTKAPAAALPPPASGGEEVVAKKGRGRPRKDATQGGKHKDFFSAYEKSEPEIIQEIDSKQMYEHVSTEFRKKYAVYKKLHQELQRDRKEFSELYEKIQTSDSAEARLALEQRMKDKWKACSQRVNRMKATFFILHQELAVSKKRVSDFVLTHHEDGSLKL